MTISSARQRAGRGRAAGRLRDRWRRRASSACSSGGSDDRRCCRSTGSASASAASSRCDGDRPRGAAGRAARPDRPERLGQDRPWSTASAARCATRPGSVRFDGAAHRRAAGAPAHAARPGAQLPAAAALRQPDAGREPAHPDPLRRERARRPARSPARRSTRAAWSCWARSAWPTRRDRLPRDLTQIEMRKLELARAMAAEPKLLIADEAMAGLSHAEVDEILALLIRLNEQGVTIIMIEHIMRAVMGFSQRLVVLVAGRKIADGDAAGRGARSRSREGVPWRVASPSPTSTPATARCACCTTCRCTVGDGETVALLGTNGNGKSTLMKSHHGHGAAVRRQHHARDRRHARTSWSAARPRRSSISASAGARGPAAVPASSRRGEPAARRLPADRRARRSPRNLDFCFETFPRLQGARAASSPAA